MNTTPVWIATAGQEFTLYITNASDTTAQQEITLNSTAIANGTGGIKWTIRVPWSLLSPQPVYANWYVIITENIDGINYVSFTFETANESIIQLLTELSNVGGYLMSNNGKPYHLWNYYNGFNPTTQSVSRYYEVGLPGLSVYYAWVGQGENASSWQSQGFQEVLNVFRYVFIEYVNSTIIENAELTYNASIGELTNYGYSIYQRPNLIPYGPIVYPSPVLLLPNGTIINPTCLPNTYYLLETNYVTSFGSSITVYETENNPMGLYMLNGSLLFGGYLQAYDFFNKSMVPITPVQYLLPAYQSQVTKLTSCKIQVFSNEDKPLANANNALSVNGTVIITNNTRNQNAQLQGQYGHEGNETSKKLPYYIVGKSFIGLRVTPQ
ncbi:hypothetical protein GCM10007112_02140 [Vulcanisaeta souniana JCM 11219]|uniref:Uncharacterized protein n=1 Tax=Vulcanisaeta souniana JCM 11219 TaxID=1293586 RepID=A0A830E6T4_9CREN|nr:hypothetical protein GCM10007112_02140 [Vulcanisaeta souniana JCM 11219]